MDYGGVTTTDAIPSYFFTAPDASTHIFDFLADPLYQHFYGWETNGGNVLNWTYWCHNARSVFLGYGPFLGCLLYPNVTRNVRDGTLPAANLTAVGFMTTNETEVAVSRYLRSIYPTCLAAYCASQADCAATNACDVGSLLTDGYELSAQGVSNCWQTLCSLDVQVVNPDIAGIGILMSYLIQSIVALLALLTLAALALFVRYYDRQAATTAAPSSALGTHGPAGLRRRRLDQAKRHWEVVNATLADFHKAQCYLAIALQIASFVILFRERSTTNYIDQNLLLLVSLDGLIPIVLALYTLAAFGKKSWYMIVLSVITVVLASATGGLVARGVLLTQPGDSSVSVGLSTGGDWPAACQATGPEGVCAGFGPNTGGWDNDASAFIAIMAVLDTVTGLLVLWKILTDSAPAWFKDNRRWLTGRLAPRPRVGRVGALPPAQAQAQAQARTQPPAAAGDAARGAMTTTPPSPSTTRSLGRLELVAAVVFHILVAAAILGCLAVEFYYFGQIFQSPFVDFGSWGFGQIVGITIWAGIFIEVAYLEYYGVDEGSDWRFPKWLRVKTIVVEESKDPTQSKNTTTQSMATTTPSTATTTPAPSTPTHLADKTGDPPPKVAVSAAPSSD